MMSARPSTSMVTSERIGASARRTLISGCSATKGASQPESRCAPMTRPAATVSSPRSKARYPARNSSI
jgi:hypothetical protein